MATRFCTQCGQVIPEGSRFCTNCGAPIPVAPSEPHYAQQQTQHQQQQQQQQQQQYNPKPTTVKPKSYLVMAILSTIFCCLPFGIVSIYLQQKLTTTGTQEIILIPKKPLGKPEVG